MLLINCPHCGERNEDEFLYGRDAAYRRPANPDVLTDREWCAYIYCVPNTKGWADEYWWHVHGCNRWIIVRRNSGNNELRSSTDENDCG